jgi:hypothetical protein
MSERAEKIVSAPGGGIVAAAATAALEQRHRHRGRASTNASIMVAAALVVFGRVACLAPRRFALPFDVVTALRARSCFREVRLSAAS